MIDFSTAHPPDGNQERDEAGLEAALPCLGVGFGESMETRLGRQ